MQRKWTEKERAMEWAVQTLASGLAATIYEDDDYEVARYLCERFIRAVEALVLLRKMRSEGLVLPLRR